MPASLLSPSQRYAAGGLLALALRQAQLQQLAANADHQADRTSGTSSDDGEDETLWTHHSNGLLRPGLRFLEVDRKAWAGLEETAASSEVKNHIEAYFRLIFEKDADNSSEKSEQELALAKAVEAMVLNLEDMGGDMESYTDHVDIPGNNETDPTAQDSVASDSMMFRFDQLSLDPNSMNNSRKLTLLYELLSACIASVQDASSEENESSLRKKDYDSRHRVALRLLATWLDVKWTDMEAIETIVASSAMAAAKEQANKEKAPKVSKWENLKRGGIIGAAALTGGALLAISGGLAAPAIAAGFSALAPTLGTIVPVIGAGGFAAIASVAGSAAGSVAVAASFGAAGAGLTGSKMARRIGDVKEFEFKPIGESQGQGRLSVSIFISGFAFEEEDFKRPWESWKDNSERYILQWESQNIIAVSTAIQDWLTSKVTMELMRQGVMRTVLSSLCAALAWPATLLSAADFIDSKWSIAIDRSDKSGKLLAETLRRGLQGNRPVTLVGFSLGARVIFKCLQELSQSGENEGYIERVVLLGAPVSVDGENWESARKMVAGRFINVYSRNDWILGITYRASMLTQGLAGIQAINVPGVENVDVTTFIDGRHSFYLRSIQQILSQLELNNYFPGSPNSIVASKEADSRHLKIDERPDSS